MTTHHLRFAGDEIQGVAVAVRRTSPGVSTHTGVLHRHTNGQLFLLHLGGDCDLSCEVFDGTFAWVIPDLLPEEADEVRAVCRAVWREMPEIHYSFRFDPEAVLDRNSAQVISQYAPFGLTCSTFVMAVFNPAHLRMIDITGWPARADDARWYGALLRYMQRNSVDPAHIARIQSDVSCIRIRPEEVAGSCFETSRPAQFAQCEAHGKAILASLDTRTDTSLNRSTVT